MLLSRAGVGEGSRGGCVEGERRTWMIGVVVIEIDKADADGGR